MKKQNLLLTLLFSIFAFVSLAAQAITYPVEKSYPTAMGDGFFQIDGYNTDGTLISNPVIDAPVPAAVKAGGASYPNAITLSGTTYLLKKLSSDDSITFNGKDYVVYSALPLKMTIPYAYQHITTDTSASTQGTESIFHNLESYYDRNEGDGLLDFPLLLSDGLLRGDLADAKLTPAEATEVPGDPSQVRTIQSSFFLPNLPNTDENHDGATANIYWTVDPWIGHSAAKPKGSKIHMLPYGWALDATADQSIVLEYLSPDGGTPKTELNTPIQQATAPFNYWKSLLSMSPEVNDKILSLINTWRTSQGYPFPSPTWLQNGIYLPYQPMPGFQNNLIRWYTPWGTWNLLNNTTGLFVRQSGAVEFPIDQQSKQLYPLALQTWDGSQRFTVLNQTDDAVPSSQDQYPGNEYYFASNVYLPGKAGVITSYKNYKIYDSTGKLNPRQTDIWFGLKGDAVENVMVWDDANGTEPGGQGNKPYMMGADVSANPQNGYTYYNLRLSHSNSFMIAELPKEQDAKKMYATTLYIDKADGKGYQKVATLSYTWQPWSIGKVSGNLQWVVNPKNTSAGAWVPEITVDPKAGDLANFISVAQGMASAWDPKSMRVIPWQGLGVYTSQANKAGGPIYFYTIGASLTNAGDSSPVADAAKAKFLIVLTSETATEPVNNYALVPPDDANGKPVQILAKIPADSKQATTINSRYPFAVTATPDQKLEQITVTKIGSDSVTCNLSLNTSAWSLSTSSDQSCQQYFEAGNQPAGDIKMKSLTPAPPPTTVSYTFVPPKNSDGSNVAVTANMDGNDISFSDSKTIPVKTSETVTITGIGGVTNLNCGVSLDTNGWNLNGSDCEQYFTASAGAPGSSINLQLPVVTPPPAAGVGYYVIVPAVGTTLNVANTSGVTQSAGLQPNSRMLEVSSDTPVHVTVTATNGQDPDKKAICTLNMSSVSWAIAPLTVNQPGVTDCDKFGSGGTTAGTSEASALVIGVGPPDKTPTSPSEPPPNNNPPPVSGTTVYYLIAPGSGDTVDLSSTGNGPSGTIKQPLSFPMSSDTAPVTTTIHIIGPTGNEATCAVTISPNGWSIASQQPGGSNCNYLPPGSAFDANNPGAPGHSATSPLVIGVGVP